MKFLKKSTAFCPLFNDLSGNFEAIGAVIKAWRTQKLQNLKKNHEFSEKFTVFSVLFNDHWGKYKATSTVINALITQKLQILKKHSYFF